MKIACDVNVSKKTIRDLKIMGYDVCHEAQHGEPDAKWFSEALDKGAEVFISEDTDIGRLVAQNYDKKIKWILFPSLKYNDGAASRFLLERLGKIKELWY